MLPPEQHFETPINDYPAMSMHFTNLQQGQQMINDTLHRHEQWQNHIDDRFRAAGTVAAPGGPAVQTAIPWTTAHVDWVGVPNRPDGVPTTTSTILLSSATCSLGESPHKVRTFSPLYILYHLSLVFIPVFTFQYLNSIIKLE
jgi:hypothetical protein